MMKTLFRMLKIYYVLLFHSTFVIYTYRVFILLNAKSLLYCSISNLRQSQKQRKLSFNFRSHGHILYYRIHYLIVWFISISYVDCLYPISILLILAELSVRETFISFQFSSLAAERRPAEGQKLVFSNLH